MQEIARGTVVGEYVVVDAIAQDDRGRLLRATRKGHGSAILRVVSMHGVSNESIARFKHDAAIVAKVIHPNIVASETIGVADVGCYSAFGAIKSETLAACLQREGRISVPVALQIGRQVCEALCVAHHGTVVHGTLSPDNILIDAAGHVGLIDFGVVHLLAPNATQQNAIPAPRLERYLAPEQHSHAPTGPESDLYALGVVLCEMMVGPEQFGMAEARTAAGGHEGIPHDLVVVLPDPLRAVVARMTQRDPMLRYPDASAVSEELKRLLDQLAQKKTPSMRGNIYVGENAQAKATGDVEIEDALRDFDLSGATSSAHPPERPLVHYGKVDKKPINFGALLFGGTIVFVVVAVVGLLYQLAEAGVFSSLGGGGWTDLLRDGSLGNWDNPRQPGNMGEWYMEGGVLCNRQSFRGQVPLGTLDIATKVFYQDFELIFEYRAEANTNSGVYLRGSVEVQILEGADGTTTKDIGYNGAIFGLHPPLSDATHPVGDWNSVYIRYVGNALTVQINGTMIHNEQRVEEVTDKGVSSLSNNPGARGPIMLQNLKGKVCFRNMRIRPIDSGA